MNTVIILSGGTGTRMKGIINCPKQYYKINGKPVISYCLSTFQNHYLVDKILIASDKKWTKYLNEWIKRENITKFWGFADAGETRQLSIYNSLIQLKKIMKEDDVILVHDAARPLVSNRIITDSFQIPKGYEGVMPTISASDTMYQSEDGKSVSKVLQRDKVYSGQAPESFIFGKYLKIHEKLPENVIAMSKGSSEIAFQNGMKIAMIRGEERNVKITNPEDLNIIKAYLEDVKK